MKNNSPQILVIENTKLAPAGTIGEALQAAGAELHVMNILEGDELRNSMREQFDGLVVLGGPMGAHCSEEYPQMETILELIRYFYSCKLPYLGICLGSQLLARALGMPPRPNVGWEIGFVPMTLTAAAAEDRLFYGLAPQQQVYHLHEDNFYLPEDAVLLATGEVCRNQAYRVGPYAYGVQFHPEVNAEIICEWANSFLSKDDGSNNMKVIADMLYRDNDLYLQGLKAFSETLAQRWLALVEEQKTRLPLHVLESAFSAEP